WSPLEASIPGSLGDRAPGWPSPVALPAAGESTAHAPDRASRHFRLPLRGLSPQAPQLEVRGPPHQGRGLLLLRGHDRSLDSGATKGTGGHGGRRRDAPDPVVNRHEGRGIAEDAVVRFV